MEQRIIFRNKLEELVKRAEASGGRLGRAEVEHDLGDALDAQQMELVFQYLEQQKIIVDGWSQDTRSRLAGRAVLGGSVSEADDEKMLQDDLTGGEEGAGQKDLNAEGAAEPESEWTISALETYLEELGAFADVDMDTRRLLLLDASAGDAEAMQRLAEVYLPMVADLVGEYEKDAAMPVEDLLQEGNIALWMALSDLEDLNSVAALEAKLMNAVSVRIEEALKEEMDEADTDEAMVKKVNRLSEAIRNLEAELEHTVSVEELSAYLEMPASQIEDILKLAGDELKKDE